MSDSYLIFFQIPIVLHKDVERDEQGSVVYEQDGRGKQVKYRCGFRIGGGIDQDFTQCPHGYKDTVSHIHSHLNVLFSYYNVYDSQLVQHSCSELKKEN